MSKLRLCCLVASAVVAIGLSGCLEMDREQYRDDAAQDVCDRALECDNLDNLFGNSYESHSECIIEERGRFNNMWPESECGNDRIDPEAYDRCMERARLAACDGNFMDQISALSECDSDQVCTN